MHHSSNNYNYSMKLGFAVFSKEKPTNTVRCFTPLATPQVAGWLDRVTELIKSTLYKSIIIAIKKLFKHFQSFAKETRYYIITFLCR